MGYETDIPQALAAFGLPFEYTAGWSTAGSSSFAPRGVVDHWTAGPRGSRSRPSLNVVKHGRPGLPGPLCNVYLDRYGKSVIVAAGRANHAGAGGWKGLTGNSSVFGIEAESAGDGDWTREQQEAYPRLNAALLSLTPNAGNPDYVCGHNEWAPTRKIDIRDWPMSNMRVQVRAVLAGATAPEIKEIDMTTVHWVERGAIFTLGPQFIKHEDNYDRAAAVRNVLGRGPEPTKSTFIDVNDEVFGALIESLGIPWYAVQSVLDGHSFLSDGRPSGLVPGQEGKGKFWSREMEMVQTLLKVDGIDPAQVASVLSAAADKAFANLTGDMSGKITFEKAATK